MLNQPLKLSDTARRLLAESFGCFALIFCGTGAIVINDVSNGAIGHAGIAITFGLTATFGFTATLAFGLATVFGFTAAFDAGPLPLRASKINCPSWV
jgi:aquaporin Z